LSNGRDQGAVDLTINKMPLRLFYFKDLSKPMTIEPARDTIRCSALIDGCSEGMIELPLMTMHHAFGSGVTLKRVQIEITSEPFSEVINLWLPWLQQLGGKYLHGQSSARGAPYALHGGNFKI